MNKDQQQQTTQQQPPHTNPVSDKAEVFMAIRRVTAWVMIMSAILFALIGILAVWEVLGKSAGEVLGRAFLSLAILAFASLIVNVASRAVIGKQ
ncbi:MAG TPA: hypothetical protein VFZ48_04510 [Candidatus Saccharimonadales bacterium]